MCIRSDFEHEKKKNVKGKKDRESDVPSRVLFVYLPIEMFR